MNHEQIRIKKGPHASQRPHINSGPVLLQTNTHQSSQLQHYRNLGNDTVQRLIDAGAIQAKLTIGQPNDKYEQEADRVADQIMRMPEGSLVNSHWSLGEKEKEISPLVQRKSSCSECMAEEEELIQTKPLADQITPLVNLQTNPDYNQAPEISSNIESGINSLKGGGQPLSESTRSFFEPRFGSDFSQVRVYTDTRANEAAKSLNARAFTLGNDIIFGKGQYSFGTEQGRHLMAHELIHVMQQAGGQAPLQLQLLRFTNNNVDFDFNNINIQQLCFNAGPGRVGQNIRRNTGALFQRSPQRWLNFYSGSPTRGAPPCAWDFISVIGFTYSTSMGQRPDFHIGFIQTCEQIRYEAHYQNLTPKILDVTNARDADNSNVQAPWYNDLNQFCGPVSLWVNNPQARIMDMPTTIVRVWGHQTQQQNPLQRVNATGTFHIWLVVKHPNDPDHQFNFLYNISVQYDRSWSYQGNGQPYSRELPSSYPGTGRQQIVSQREGRGSATPVITGQIATEQLNQQASALTFP